MLKTIVFIVQLCFLSYNTSIVLQCRCCNVTIDPRRCIIPDGTIAEHVGYSFPIKIDNSSEVNSPVMSQRNQHILSCVKLTLLPHHKPG